MKKIQIAFFICLLFQVCLYSQTIDTTQSIFDEDPYKSFKKVDPTFKPPVNYGGTIQGAPIYEYKIPKMSAPNATDATKSQQKKTFDELWESMPLNEAPYRPSTIPASSIYSGTKHKATMPYTDPNQMTIKQDNYLIYIISSIILGLSILLILYYKKISKLFNKETGDNQIDNESPAIQEIDTSIEALSKINELKNSGVLNQEEFDTLKNKILHKFKI